MNLTKQQIDDMRTSLGHGAQPFSKDAIDSLCALALKGLAVPEEQPVSDLVLDFARGIVGAEGFYTQAAVTVARELLRISGREPQKEPE